jgi:hypothetical protein
MRTDCNVKLSKLQKSELNTPVQKETSGDVEAKPPPSDKVLFCSHSESHERDTGCTNEQLADTALQNTLRQPS